MNILKPEQLSLTSQPLDWRGVLHQSFTVGLGFDLVSGALLPADAAWAAAMQGLATGDCIDTGLPKKQPEWLLAGCAHSPENAPMSGMLVQVCVGQSSREWLVRADATNTSFTAVPLIWANTWGSPKHPENPLGCGIEPGPDGKTQLPMVVEKFDLDRRPACPGPLGAWPCRMKNMGTYNAAWLKTRWPGVPDDFDWAFFNLAQPAQRLAELKGGEHLVLKHLHPDHPTLELYAPIHSIRVEIQRSEEPAKDPAWSQIAATRDTLWLFPNQLTGLYLWHALTPCADEAATDISAIRLTLDPPVADTAQSAVAVEALAAEALDSEGLGLAEATGLNATGAHMDRARLRFCILDNADFSAASLNRADFHTASLRNVSFANANLSNASFGAQSAAPGLNCTGAVLAGSTWQGVACVGGVFTGSKADGATFNDCDLSASSWRGAVAKNADFSRCNLSNADLDGANLFKASLREAKVETASLNGANLYGADLYRLGVGPQTGMAGTNTTATILTARKEVA